MGIIIIIIIIIFVYHWISFPSTKYLQKHTCPCLFPSPPGSPAGEIGGCSAPWCTQPWEGAGVTAPGGIWVTLIGGIGVAPCRSGPGCWQGMRLPRTGGTAGTGFFVPCLQHGPGFPVSLSFWGQRMPEVLTQPPAEFGSFSPVYPKEILN